VKRKLFVRVAGKENNEAAHVEKKSARGKKKEKNEGSQLSGRRNIHSGATVTGFSLSHLPELLYHFSAVLFQA
jgi:hypothetical protein